MMKQDIQNVQKVVSNCIAVTWCVIYIGARGSSTPLLNSFVTLEKLLLPTSFSCSTEIIIVLSYMRVIEKNNILNHGKLLRTFTRL